MGVAMWLVERPTRAAKSDSAVASLRDGVYWAVVTMTTVGYGDKTPKTAGGHALAVLWMLVSVALISILSTTLVSKMTADRVEGAYPLADADLAGKRLAAVAHSSGAEYLDARRLRYASFDDLPAALAALEVRPDGRGRQQHRRAPVSDRRALQAHDRGAARRPRPRLHGLRPAARQRAEETARPRADRNHREPGMAENRGELFRAVGPHCVWTESRLLRVAD